LELGNLFIMLKL